MVDHPEVHNSVGLVGQRLSVDGSRAPHAEKQTGKQKSGFHFAGHPAMHELVRWLQPPSWSSLAALEMQLSFAVRQFAVHVCRAADGPT